VHKSLVDWKAFAFACFLAIAVSLVFVAAGSGEPQAEGGWEAAQGESQEAAPEVMPAPMAAEIEAGYEHFLEARQARATELESPAYAEERLHS